MLRLLLSALGKPSFVIFMNTMSVKAGCTRDSCLLHIHLYEIYSCLRLRQEPFAGTLDLAASFVPLEIQNKPQVTELTTASVLARDSSHEVEYSEFRV